MPQSSSLAKSPQAILPARPNLEYLKKLSKEKLALLRADRPAAKLADAQLAVAREHGFDSWRQLKAQIDSSASAEQIAACKEAIRRGDLNAVRKMVRIYPSLLRADTGNGATALHVAAEFNHPTIIKLLIGAGANISAQFGRYAHTPLSWALMSRSFEAVNTLVAAGAQPDLFCAAGMGDLKTVRSFFTADGALRPGASATGSSRYGTSGELLPFPPADDREVVSDALYSAARNGQAKVVAELLQHQPLLDFRAYMGGTPLHWAYFGASKEAIDLMLSAGADPNIRDDVFKCTPRAFGICVAANWGILKLVECQLANDPELVNIVGGRGTPLHEATKGGDPAVVSMLLDHGANPDALDSERKTPAEIARAKNDNAVLRELEKKQNSSDSSGLLNQFLDAAVPKPDSDHKSGSLEPARKLLADAPALVEQSIFAACVVGDAKIVRRFLSQDRALARATGGPRDWPALCYLTFSRFLRDEKKRAGAFLECAKLLLDAGADPNSSWPAANDPAYRETALYGAAGIANCAPLTQLLIDAGADVNDHESLYHASEFADNAALRVLLKAKPQQDWVSYNLCHKMDMEDPAGVKLFIEHGADVNVLLVRGLFKGSRPLHFAIYRRRSLKVFRILLQAGADPNLADSNGVTPYQLARKLGLNAIARLLKSKGALDQLDPRTEFLAAMSSGDRKTANAMLKSNPNLMADLTEQDFKLLVDAAESGRVNAVRLMLDHGFPITTRGTSYGGWDATALDQAAWNGHAAIVRLLLKRGADPTVKHGFGGDALGAAIHGANHADHSRLTAIEPLARVATQDRLQKAIAYAKIEPNQKVTAILEKVLASLRAD